MSEEIKPLINIKLPISCKTKKDVVGSVVNIFEYIINGIPNIFETCCLNKIIVYPTLILVGIYTFLILSIPGYIFGGIIIGSIIGVATGHGNEVMSETMFFYGGIVGIIIEWVIVGIHKGVIKFSCRS